MVGTSSMAHDILEPADDGIHLSIRLPGVEVGTVGGGTGLPHARAYLALLGCLGPGRAYRLAQIVAAAALCLELSASASASLPGQLELRPRPPAAQRPRLSASRGYRWPRTRPRPRASVGAPPEWPAALAWTDDWPPAVEMPAACSAGRSTAAPCGPRCGCARRGAATSLSPRRARPIAGSRPEPELQPVLITTCHARGYAGGAYLPLSCGVVPSRPRAWRSSRVSRAQVR